jgi:hypothetical protein
VVFEGYSMRQLPPTLSTRVRKRAGEMFGFHMHAHVSDGPIAEDSAQVTTALIVRRTGDVLVKVVQTTQRQLI